MSLDYLRTCEVNGQRGLFHQWEQFYNVVAPSVMVGGHPGGQVGGCFGIVEFGDGTVKQVEVGLIRFTDIAESIQHGLIQHAEGKQ